MQQTISTDQLCGAVELLAAEHKRAGNTLAEDFVDFDTARLATFAQRGFLVGMKSRAGVGREFSVAGVAQVLGMLELYFRGALALKESAAHLRAWTAPAGLTAKGEPVEPCYTFADEEGRTFLAIVYGLNGHSSAHVLPEAAVMGGEFSDPLGLVNERVPEQIFSECPALVCCLTPVLERAKAVFDQ